MAEAEVSFSQLVWRRAIRNTMRRFRSKLWDAFYVLLSLGVGCGIYCLFWGLPRAVTEALPIVVFSFAPLGIFVFCVMLWHLCLAPEELVYEAVQGMKFSATASGDGGTPSHSLVDADTRTSAGRVGQLGEVIGRHGFEGFRRDTTDEMQFRWLMESAHPIWTKPKPRQLRRDLENQTGRIIAANKGNDAKDRAAVAAELAQTVDALTAILLGEAAVD